MISVLALVVTLQTAAGEPLGSPPPPPSGASPAAPRTIDDLSKPLTGAVPQGSYETGVRGAFSRNQSLQGPLDGTWILKTATGAALFRVQFVDPGFSGGRLEGAWQDLRAGAAMDSSGFFSGVMREGAKLTLQFARPGEGPNAVTLDQRADGRYAGELNGQAVVLGRP